MSQPPGFHTVKKLEFGGFGSFLLVPHCCQFGLSSTDRHLFSKSCASCRAIISHCEVARQVSFASAGQFLQALVSLSSGTEELFLTVFRALLSNTKNARVLHCIVDYTIVEKKVFGHKIFTLSNLFS